MDDKTCFTWIYLLKQKSDVLTIFPDFYTLINTQFGAKIKFVRTNNSPELAFIDFFFIPKALILFILVWTHHYKTLWKNASTNIC